MSEMESGPAPRSEERPRTTETAEPPPPPPRAREEVQIDPEAWMVTFSDLLTLLMTFFVLIFASQDPVPPETLYQAFGQTSGVFGLFRTGFLENIVALPRRDISQDLVQVFLDEIGASEIEVEQREGGLVITLPTDAYFQPGSAVLNQRARNRIDQLSLFLSISAHRVRVEGHSDDRERVRAPLRGRYELSLARAHRVLRRLIDNEVDEDRLALVGYGPSRPRYDNVSRRGRRLNRRVDIVILNRPGRVR